MRVIFALFGMVLSGSIMSLLYCRFHRAIYERYGIQWDCLFMNLTILFWCVPVGALLNYMPVSQAYSVAIERYALLSDTINRTTVDANFLPVIITANGQSQLLANITQLLLFSIWLIGGLIVLYQKQKDLICLCRYLKQSVPAPNNDPALLMLQELKKQMGILRPVKLIYRPLISTPVSYGIIHPVIVLPGIIKDDADLRLVLTHELTHIKLFDFPLKQLCIAIQCVFWFIPIVHRLSRAVEQVSEYRCDSIVTQNSSNEECIQYALLLVSYSSQRTPKQFSSVSPLGESCGAYIALKERISFFMNPKKTVSRSRKCLLAIGLLVLVLCNAGLASASSYYYVVDATPHSDNAESIVKSVKWSTDLTSYNLGSLNINDGSWQRLEGFIPATQPVAADPAIESRTYYIKLNEDGTSILQTGEIVEPHIFCQHTYTNTILAEHVLYIDDSCETRFYDVIMCTKCKNVTSMIYTDSHHYAKCPH